MSGSQAARIWCRYTTGRLPDESRLVYFPARGTDVTQAYARGTDGGGALAGTRAREAYRAYVEQVGRAVWEMRLRDLRLSERATRRRCAAPEEVRVAVADPLAVLRSGSAGSLLSVAKVLSSLTRLCGRV